MKPIIHARSSVKKYGGSVDDYLPIHQRMDSTKSAFPDNRHRAIFHTDFGIFVIEEVFGVEITNSDGKKVSVRDIAEQHCLEDFGGYIPSLSDFLSVTELKPWMCGDRADYPPSAQKHRSQRRTRAFVTNPEGRLVEQAVKEKGVYDE
jgi:hypothetical protein